MSSRSSPDARLPAKVNRKAAHAQADCAVTDGVQDGARRCGIPGGGSDRVQFRGIFGSDLTHHNVI